MLTEFVKSLFDVRIELWGIIALLVIQIFQLEGIRKDVREGNGGEE